uniref:Histone deacetylase complex subunit SAP18 n=1 Tax=Tetraselmis sp. GSL018 TaxID=582737 RepID=A0A061R694_9CHLO|mmetsp:Transcript_23891/g.56926  ORF Transcript_23891/g.56926 Transcript_23891/m.56926 type:complete len:170 (-) Transcript_23891:209-718(-)
MASTLTRAATDAANDTRRNQDREARRAPPGPPGPPGPPTRQAPPGPPSFEVDRVKTCPLLLRVFPKLGGHHKLEEFQKGSELPKGEVQVYTWMDATLRELTDLVKEVQPPARKPHARLSFSFVYPDRRGRNVMRQVGMVISGKQGDDDSKTLKQLNFQIGDYLDVAIHP